MEQKIFFVFGVLAFLSGIYLVVEGNYLGISGSIVGGWLAYDNWKKISGKKEKV